jgi:hypothetical protein
MFPGFIYMYKDNNEYIHLFFFKGINEDYNFIYKDLDLSKLSINYTETKINDYTFDYQFDNKTIKKIVCNLVKLDNKIEQKILSF